MAGRNGSGGVQMGSLYSFGFNAFGQVDPDSNQKEATHHDVSNVLFTTWESTVISTGTSVV